LKKHLYIILFTISLFHTSLLAQWLQQTLPVSGQINDLVFLNKDTGFAALDNSNFLRTTNGGTNWTLTSNFRILVLNKIDSVTAYGMGVVNSKIYRTFNGGTTWDSVSPAGSMCWISFISRDTGWISTLGGIYKTTNGGTSAVFISNQQSCGKLTFLKTKYGNENYGWVINSGLFKTTNSGVNWSNITGISINAINLFFLNKDTGWVTERPPADNYKILFTTNAGVNWITQYTNSISISYLFFVTFLKGWCGTDTSNTILATVNGGLTWGKQTIPIINSGHTFFVDSLVGWTSNGFNFNNLAKTTNGGGNITYSAVEPISNEIPNYYTLKQNYPNPFNPVTIIEFSLPKRSLVKLIIYDVLGRVIEVIANEELSAGTYKASWNAEKYSSGLYYYKLITENYTETRKMVLLK